MATIIRDDNDIPELIEALTDMKGRTINVGILEEGEQAMIGHVHEYGVDIEVTPLMRAYLHYEGIHLREETTHIKIPERSYIRKFANEEMDKVVKKADTFVDAVLALGIDADTFLDMLGEELADGMKDVLTAVTDPPLTDWTKDKKGSSKPLEDTGSLRDSIDYEVN